MIAISAGGVGNSWPTVSPFLKFLFSKSTIGVAYKDLNVMESIFAESEEDWVCVRPTTLTNDELSQKVKVVERYGLNSKISRKDVAWFILENLNKNTPSRTPMIET